MKITTLDKDVKGVLSSHYYKIPRFQRPYSWLREHVDDYWNDTVVEVEEDYFIGSMVVYVARDDVCRVVDGQQRLTTIMMMLCAIREELKDEGFEDLALGIHGLLERPDINNQMVYVLTTQSSYPYFQEYILKYDKPTIEVEIKTEEENLARAYKQIRDYIKASVDVVRQDPLIKEGKRKNEIQKKLLSLRDAILAPKLIFVELENEDDAYAIFETLNTRGKELGVSDLVKTYLTRAIKKRNAGVDTATLQWKSIVDCIGSSSVELDLNTYIHHFWLSRYDYLPIKKLYKQLKKTVKKSTAQGFLNTLEADSGTYRELNETSFRVWNNNELEIKEALDAFKIFKIQQEVPMVLAVLREYRDGILKPKDVQRMLKSIEYFHFIFTAVTSQRSSGGISQMYASSARELTRASTRDEKIVVMNKLMAKLGEKKPSYKEFEANFAEICFTDKRTKQKELVKYILKGIQREVIKGLALDYNLMTIEHIAPQKPKDDCTCSEEKVGLLGNLLLVTQKLNGELGNKDYKTKKDILGASDIKIDEIINKYEVWDDGAIDVRTAWMCELAYEVVWKL